jgi:hypothetical protein
MVGVYENIYICMPAREDRSEGTMLSPTKMIIITAADGIRGDGEIDFGVGRLPFSISTSN